MKKRFALKLICLVSVFIFLISATNLFADTLKLRLSSMWPPHHPHTKLLEQWGKDVEKATNGRVTVTVFAGNTLSPPMQVFDNTVKGIVDVGSTLLAYAPGRLPLSEVLQLPLGYKDGYQATKLANAYYKKFRPKEFDDVKLMFLHGAAPGFLFTKKPIKSIEEAKGLRIRANAENIGIVKAIGAAPVTMPISEAYDALSRGIVDGTLFPIEPLQGFKLAEVVKTVLENHGISYMTSFYVIMNKDKWNKISPEDQKAIEKINEEYIEKFGKQWVELDNKAKEFSKTKGVTFVSVSKQEEEETAKKMKPVLDEYVKMAKSKGLPGEEALKFCQEYLKQHR